jgi:pilus assembly protein CpaD
MTRAFTTYVFGAIALLCAPLGACAPDRIVTGSAYPTDYQERHPIVLAHAPKALDIFVAPGGLDPRQSEEIHEFATEYRRYGEGSMRIEVPAHPGTPIRRSVSLVRSALAEAGVPAQRTVSSTYTVADRGLAAPIRLSFQRVQAKVGSRCGLWPQDLGVSNAGFNNSNNPYWNFGCAMQSNVAAQVDDPLDLVRGRPEGRVDTVRRMNNIEKLRQGEDPSTKYSAQDDKINKAIGN